VSRNKRQKWPQVRPVTSIIVPVWDEAESVLELVRRIKATVAERPTEVIFVDDSHNHLTTRMIVLAMIGYRSDNFDVRVYHRIGVKRWGSLSGAVSDGIYQARSNQIIVIDGDLQHPPEVIPSMIAAANSHNIVVASRYCKGGHSGGLDGKIRHLVSRSSTLLVKAFFPFKLRKVSDPMTGFFLVDRQFIDTSKLRPMGFKILLEILATHHKLSLAEVPLKFAQRSNGMSHGNLEQGKKFLEQLLNLRIGHVLNIINRLPKFVQFGAIGGSVFIIGMVMLFVLVGVFGWSPLAANALQLVLTFWLNYTLNSRITWRERGITQLAATKFFVSRTATTVLSYGLFTWLLHMHASLNLFGRTLSFSINYLVANLISMIIITLLNYLISDRWAFATPNRNRINIGFSPVLLVGLAAFVILYVISGPTLSLSILMAVAGLALFAQSSMEIWRMTYAYRVPEAVDKLRFPAATTPHERFCLIVPARHEADVLASTLRQLARQSHPSVDIVTVICDDDYDTLRVAYDTARVEPRLQVMQYPLQHDTMPSKPLQLNYVFEQIANNNYTAIGVIDAEDTVHPELLIHIDAAFRDKSVGIVQGGVQLMNHDSSWYSLHNVLEYYRWFSSAMSFQAANKFMPLGGNTIFVRESLLREAGGWPVTLTEDCSLGVQLSTRFQAKTAVYYEPHLATREETPDSLKGLFKQRVRWNQGFFHEWNKGVWRELPLLRQRLLANYILLCPVILATINVFMIFSVIAALTLNAPVTLVLLMYLPFIPASLLAILNTVFLYDFGKAFHRKITFGQYVTLLTTYILYQIMLNAAAFWAIVRELRGENSWYKTTHTGQHRLDSVYAPADLVYASVDNYGGNLTGVNNV